MVGTPAFLLGLLVIYAAATQKLLPKMVYYGLAAFSVAGLFFGPQSYAILKHGREAEAADEKRDA